MFHLDHLTPDELAALRDGKDDNVGKRYHLQGCGACRRALASSLLLGGLMRPPQSKPGSRHLSATDIDRYHANAFEGAETEVRWFLSAHRHLMQCDACYTRLFALHQELTPAATAVKAAVRAFAAGRTTRRLGSLRIVRRLGKVVQQFSKSVARAPTEPATLAATLMRALKGNEPAGADGLGRMEEEGLAPIAARYAFLAPMESAALEMAVDSVPDVEPERAAREVPPTRPKEPPTLPEPLSIEVAGLVIQAVPLWHENAMWLGLEIREQESGKPRSGVQVVPVNEDGEPAEPRLTDRLGRVVFSLDPAPAALHVYAPAGAKPWVLDLSVLDFSSWE